MPTTFPPQVQVIVRDWLSANHVLLKGRDAAVLVDTGYVSRAPMTLALVQHALGGLPLAAIVNTHCHSDHMGGNAALARAHRCGIAIPQGEVPLIDAWDEKALLLGYCDQTADRFKVDEALQAGMTYRWGDLDWQAIAAPGHDMGALCFFNAEHGVLISGDALWANGFGFVMPPELDERAMPATRATLETLARLPIRSVVPGHGDPFGDVDLALERAFARLHAFEAEPQRLAEHAMKVVLAFALLERGSIALDTLPEYLSGIGIYREFNARFTQLTPDALAGRLVASLQRAGAARKEAGHLFPTASAH